MGSFVKFKFALIGILFLVIITAMQAQGTRNTLYFPRLFSADESASIIGGRENTAFAVINFDNDTAFLTLTAYDTSGQLIRGEGITNPSYQMVSSGKQLPIYDTQIFGNGLTTRKIPGWVKVESSARKTVGFFLVLNDPLNGLDGADVYSSILKSFVLPEVAGRGFTQIHIVNPDAASPASVTLELLSAAGSVRRSVSRTLNPNGAVAEFIIDLFPGTEILASDYIRAVADRGVIPFELIGEQNRQVRALNGQDASAAATVLYCPQYVVGGADYLTLLSVINLDINPATLTLEFFGDDGARIAVKQAGLEGKGKLHITDQSFFANATGTLQGYLKITSSGPRIAGSVVFSDQSGGVFSTALPLVSTLKDSMAFAQLASDATWFTGCAILNPHDEPVNALIDVFDYLGFRIASKMESIPAGQRRSRLLTEYFPELAGQDRTSGYFRILANKKLASYAVYGTNTLSVLSAVPSQTVPFNYDGTWKGGSNTGGPLSLEIQVLGNRIMGVTIGLSLISGTSTCTSTYSKNVLSGAMATLYGDSFNLAFDYEGLKTDLAATFTSSSTMSGAFGAVTLPGSICGLTSLPGGSFSVSK